MHPTGTDRAIHTRASGAACEPVSGRFAFYFFVFTVAIEGARTLI